MKLHISNTQLLYLGLLATWRPKKLRLAAHSPTFFASVAKLLGIEIEIVETRLDYASEADVAHNFFETYEPRAQIVFQNAGTNVGEAKVFVKKSEGCVVAEFGDEEWYEKCRLFFRGGIEKGRLWNYDLAMFGLRSKEEPCEVANLEEKIAASNEVVAYFEEKFAKNPYFDTLSIGTKTYKTHYPILLKPALYCPKEDIYAALQDRGIDVQVRFKPLYKLTPLQSASLPTSEELYKAIMLLPLRKDIVEPLFAVLGKYRYRGCSF